MKYNPDIHHRRSIRLKGYDYSQPGAYFITICTYRRACLLGDVIEGDMHLNPLGNMAWQCWQAIPDHFPHAVLDAFVVMPNHVHGIVWIVDGLNPSAAMVGASDYSPLPDSPPQPSPTHSSYPRGTSKTIGSMVRGFKIGVTKWARQNTDIYAVWQRNYYEHIIRNDRALNAIRQYIAGNPARWHLDRYNDDAVGRDPRAVEIWRMLQTSRLESRDKSSNGG